MKMQEYPQRNSKLKFNNFQSEAKTLNVKIDKHW